MAKNFRLDKCIHIVLNGILILLGIVFVCSLYIGIQTTLMGKPYADFFGYTMFEVQSDSMKDEFKAGDIIIVQLGKEVETGDIISFPQDGAIITHRIIQAYNGTYVTKGDANDAPDQAMVSSEDVIGKTVTVLPGFGILRSTIFNPIVLIALAATLMIANINLEKKNKNNNKGEQKMKFLEMIRQKFYTDKSLDNRTVNIFDDNKNQRPAPQGMERIDASPRGVEPISYNNDRPAPQGMERIDASPRGVEPISYNNDRPAPQGMERIDASPRGVEPISYNNDRPAPQGMERIDVSPRGVEPIGYGVNKQEETTVEPLVYGYNKPDEKISNYIRPEAPQEEAPVVNTENKTIDNYSYQTPTAPKREEDLSKTSVFRMVSVDMSDLNSDHAYVEQVEQEKELAEEQEIIARKEALIEPEVEEEPERGITNIELELLERTTKKAKNIIDKIMLLKKGELEDLLKIIFEEESFSSSEKAIINRFSEVYIKAKYYDSYDHAKNESFEKKIYNKVDKVIKDYALDLMDEYHGSDEKHNDTVIRYGNALMVIFKLDNSKEGINDTTLKREYYHKQLSKYIKQRELSETNVKKLISAIISVQKKYDRTIKYLYEKLESDTFELVISKVSPKFNLLGTKLKHNLTFNKVYSEYIIDKTYSEGVIAEDKMGVQLTLLLNQISMDMLSSNFSKKYLVGFPSSVFSKEKKFEKFLKIFEDDYAKDNIVIVLNMADLMKTKAAIKKLVKAGYHFALNIDKTVKITERDKSHFYIMDYIFANKKKAEVTKMISNLPKDIVKEIIYEDLENKISEVGSE